MGRTEGSGLNEQTPLPIDIAQMYGRIDFPTDPAPTPGSSHHWSFGEATDHIALVSTCTNGTYHGVARLVFR